ncbi:sigma-70 family RNA polymerase sigma factor [Paraflavitalea soli]|uniref:Sigma-70 family RNA polymerase sigma factor n=1 Tax=Paraflavitalea soli TaxID=2315862 RepID=A0A3B7MHN4_9BACT|nr:sigma-70 family RNA polymerase sigma factor [Paraflavitalea soli]AXY73924.1 sigma-70 family RNA polymerase sigma factor [Paraflavitalea soli]
MPRNHHAPSGRNAARIHPVTLKILKQHYEACRDYLYAFVVQLVKNEEVAKDIVSEAFLAYLSNPHDLYSADELRALLYVICRNKAMNYLKYGSGFKPRRELNVTDPHILQQYPEMDDQLLRDELTGEGLERVRKAVKLLPIQPRTVIELMLFDELNTKEVGHRMGLPNMHVRAIKSKGLAWLRRYFNGLYLSSLYIPWEYWC